MRSVKTAVAVGVLIGLLCGIAWLLAMDAIRSNAALQAGDRQSYDHAINLGDLVVYLNEDGTGAWGPGYE